jgi:curved DNA-binding protein
MINTEKTGNMVKNMKKLSNSKDNINSNRIIGGGFSGADFGEGEDFSDFFQNMFGGAGGFGKSSRGRASGKFKGQDIQAELSLI